MVRSRLSLCLVGSFALPVAASDTLTNLQDTESYPNSDGGYVNSIGQYDAGWNAWADESYQKVKVLNDNIVGDTKELDDNIATNLANIETNQADIQTNDESITRALNRIKEIGSSITENDKLIEMRTKELNGAKEKATAELATATAQSATERGKLTQQIVDMQRAIEDLQTQKNGIYDTKRVKVKDAITQLEQQVRTDLATMKTTNQKLIADEKQNIADALKKSKDAVMEALETTTGDMALKRTQLRTNLQAAETEINELVSNNADLYGKNLAKIKLNQGEIASNLEERTQNREEIEVQVQELSELEKAKTDQKEKFDKEIADNVSAITTNAGMRATEIEARTQAITQADKALADLDTKYDAEIKDMKDKILDEQRELAERGAEATDARSGLISQLNQIKSRIYRLKRWRCGKCEQPSR